MKNKKILMALLVGIRGKKCEGSGQEGTMIGK